MTIRTKTILLLGLVTVILVATMIVTAQKIVLKGYQDLERSFAYRNLDRTMNVLHAAQEKLYSTNGDYSSWDNTYNFVVNPETRPYREENFVAASFGNINVNAMLFFNNSGVLVAQAYVANAESAMDSVPPDLVRAVQAVKGLVPQPGHLKGRFGIIVVGSKSVMVSARPILTNKSTGPSRGTLVFCRYLDSVEIQKLSSIVAFPVSIVVAAAHEKSSDSVRLHDFISSGETKKVYAVNRTTQFCCAWVPDFAGKNSFVLSFSGSRDIFRYGLRAYYYSLSWLIFIVIVFSLIVFLLIERSVLVRFIRLRNAIGTIKRDPDPSKRLPLSENDEITDLTIDINLMLAAIEQARQRAETSEQQYHLLFEQMLNGFAHFEAVRNERGDVGDFRFLEVNPAFERFTGISGAQCVGKSVREVLPDLGPQWGARFTEVLASGKAIYFESYGPTLNKHFEMMGFKTGSERCGVTFTDITNRKKAEADRARAWEDLSQAQKMQAVGQLAGGVAHDFNNQLAGILGYAELLQGNLADNAKLSGYADKVISGISRAADLTAQLLAFAHKGKFIDRPVNLHVIILEVSELLGRTIDKRISIILQLKARPAVTMGDPSQLQNVILNLGLNARDAMPGGGKLTFATDTRMIDEPFRTRHAVTIAPGRYLLVSVTDTGTGIDPEHQKHLFEPFFTTKPRGKGTGMGLAASYGTVIQHKGAITVYSESLIGTTFNVYLPLCGEAVNDIIPTKTFTAIPGNPRILVVDDESLVAEMAYELLTSLGCTVQSCSNGREAVDRYRVSWKEFDLILLDMIMPEMNGADTFREMQSINPQARIIISSGFSINNEVQSLLDLGAVAFLQKPYTLSTLSATLSNALKNP